MVVKAGSHQVAAEVAREQLATRGESVAEGIRPVVVQAAAAMAEVAIVVSPRAEAEAQALGVRSITLTVRSRC